VQPIDQDGERGQRQRQGALDGVVVHAHRQLADRLARGLPVLPVHARGLHEQRQGTRGGEQAHRRMITYPASSAGSTGNASTPGVTASSAMLAALPPM
jgi:hypothetical protein